MKRYDFSTVNEIVLVLIFTFGMSLASLLVMVPIAKDMTMRCGEEPWTCDYWPFVTLMLEAGSWLLLGFSALLLFIGSLWGFEDFLEEVKG